MREACSPVSFGSGGPPQSFDLRRHFVAGRRFPGKAGTGMSQRRRRMRLRVISRGAGGSGGSASAEGVQGGGPASGGVGTGAAYDGGPASAALRVEERWTALPKHVAGFGGENAVLFLSCAGGRV
jgi:hypothetical protein